MNWRGWVAIVGVVVVCFGVLVVVADILGHDDDKAITAGGFTVAAALGGWRAWKMRHLQD
jgi:hypothetical protein